MIFNYFSIINEKIVASRLIKRLYNRDKSVLYYYSTQQKDFIVNLNISHFTPVLTKTKHLNKGTYYYPKPSNIQLSSLLNKRCYSTLTKDMTRITHHLNPYFITGFSDAECSFLILVTNRPKSRTGTWWVSPWPTKPRSWRIVCRYQIGIHVKDLALLESIQSYFSGIGHIVKQGDGLFSYQVSSPKHISKIIIPHFEKYPLITKKKEDFILFKEVIDMVKNGEHLNPEGLQKIVNIRASINLGLSDTDKLKEAFPETVPVKRPRVKFSENIHPHWIAGFASGDGCFTVHVRKSSASKLGFSVALSFQLDQHTRDKEFMSYLVKYFNCGYVSNNGSCIKFTVSNLSDIISIMIPFFEKYPIQGVKALDFSAFCEISKLMKQKEHLNNEGFSRILKFRSSMNKNREIEYRVGIGIGIVKKTRVINLYVYNRDKSILYYSTDNIDEFSLSLNIHKSTLLKHLTKGTYYLKRYHFSREISNNVLKFLNLSLSEFNTRLMEEREKLRRNIKA
jgi:LAGLIDADG endonuclease